MSRSLAASYAEIEYFMMSKEVFKEFNLDVEIRYNNRKFLSGLLEYVNVPKENINYENAMLWVYDSCYWIKDCKVCRLVNKPLYMRGVLSPYKRE